MGDDATLLEFKNRLMGAIHGGSLQGVQDLITSDDAARTMLKQSTPQCHSSIAGDALFEAMMCPYYFESPVDLNVAILAILEIVGPHFPLTDLDEGVLLKAVDTRNADLVQSLLQLPDIDVNKPQNVPVLIAASSSVEITKILLQCENIDVNIVDCESWTPLMWACHAGDAAVVEALLAVPTLDVQHKSIMTYTICDTEYPAGITALDIAESRGHASIVASLQKRRILTITSKHDDGNVCKVTCAMLAGETVSVSVPTLATVGDLRSCLGSTVGAPKYQVKLLVGALPLDEDTAPLNSVLP